LAVFRPFLGQCCGNGAPKDPDHLFESPRMEPFGARQLRSNISSIMFDLNICTVTVLYFCKMNVMIFSHPHFQQFQLCRMRSRGGTIVYAFNFSRNPVFVFTKSLWQKDETFVKVFAKTRGNISQFW
jgi:hypothetical protein